MVPFSVAQIVQVIVDAVFVEKAGKIMRGNASCRNGCNKEFPYYAGKGLAVFVKINHQYAFYNAQYAPILVRNFFYKTHSARALINAAHDIL
jgi:hypothetical protein